ncbi:tetratricopeptide repeat protein [Xanthomarina sp. GH4-25]|uniref:tetratricopeptide repeat protein n=1 Tax=Xanthomarina sp. GH4-25 TaxID=3349335 RepID=UPI00387800CF
MKKITLVFLLITTYSFSQVDSLILQLKTVKSDTNKVKLLNEIGRKSFNTEIQLAFKYLPKAIELSKELDYQNGLIDSYKNLGTAYFYLREYDSTNVYWLKSLHSIPASDFRKKGDIYSNLGVLYQRLGIVDSSLSSYKKSVLFRKRLEDSSFVARSYNNIAALYRQKGNYHEALDYYFKALPIYRAYGLEKETSDALNGIGLLYKDLEDYTNALSYLQEAYDIRKVIKNPRLIASSINNIATIYYETEDYEQAETNYLKYLDFAEKLNDKRALAGTYSNLGNIYARKSQLKEAIAYYSNSNELFQSIGDTDNTALTLLNLGGLQYKQKNYKEANYYYKEALVNAENSKSMPYRVDAYKGLTDSYHKLKDYTKSYTNFQFYTITRDSLFNKDLSEKVAFYQERYEAEKKAKEIQILKTETIKKDKDVALFKLYRNWAVLFSLLTIITLVLLYNRYKIRQKSFQLKEALLTKEKIASELEAELQKKELELKAVELSSLTMSSLQKNKLLEDLDDKIKEFNDSESSKSNFIKELNDIVKQGLNFDDNWSTFQKHFNNVHPNFFKTLNTEFPNLTNNDLKACAYMRMNLSTKEVSILTNVTPKSVKMSRYRLKKKLNLGKDDDLKNFLFEI